jgi:putative transposase
MGRVSSRVDNSLIESFWSTMQQELLDRRSCATKAGLGSATFEWIGAFYNPRRRHSAVGCLTRTEFEDFHTAAGTAA